MLAIDPLNLRMSFIIILLREKSETDEFPTFNFIRETSNMEYYVQFRCARVQQAECELNVKYTDKEKNRKREDFVDLC